MEQQPGNIIAQLSVIAEAEVIPGPESQMKWNMEYIKKQYGGDITAEHGPELVHFENEDNK